MKALKLRENILEENHPENIISYNNIGLIYNHMGDNKNALKFYTKALKAQEKKLGDNHPLTASIYNNIAAIYDEMNDKVSALKYHTKALDIRKQILEKDHIDIANSYSDIGFVYDYMGDYLKAYDYFKKSYQIFKLNRDRNFKVLTNEQKHIFQKANERFLSNVLDSGYSYQQISDDKKALIEEIYKIFINDKGLLSDDENATTNMKDIKISDLTNQLASNELFIDIGYYGKNYYIFSIDKSGEIKFAKINIENSNMINKIIANKTNSKTALEKLHNIVISKAIGEKIYKFDSIVLSPDGELKLLPFEKIMSSEKHPIKPKQLRYVPSAKEFIKK